MRRSMWPRIWPVTAALLLCVAGAAHARDPDGRYANAPFHQWYESQYNQAGGWCCNNADAHEYDGDYKFNADGSVTLSYNGHPYAIEADKVLTGANPTGHAVWWYNESAGGEPYTWCFSPGQMG